MRGLQHLVCKSAIDTEFLRWLSRAPADAMRGFDLAKEEAELVLRLRPQSLDELARGVEAWRRGEALPVRSHPQSRQPAVPALAS